MFSFRSPFIYLLHFGMIHLKLVYVWYETEIRVSFFPKWINYWFCIFLLKGLSYSYWITLVTLSWLRKLYICKTIFDINTLLHYSSNLVSKVQIVVLQHLYSKYWDLLVQIFHFYYSITLILPYRFKIQLIIFFRNPAWILFWPIINLQISLEEIWHFKVIDFLSWSWFLSIYLGLH